MKTPNKEQERQPEDLIDSVHLKIKTREDLTKLVVIESELFKIMFKIIWRKESVVLKAHRIHTLR